MSKVSLNTFKHKFFYQIIVLSLIIISIFVAVSVTSNTSKKFFNKTKAAGDPSCTSWTDFWIEGTGGNCNIYDPGYKYSYPACKTTSRSVTLHMNVANADTMQLLNVDPSWYCTDYRIIWSQEFSGPMSTKPWTVDAGLGQKKVCGRFTNNQGEVKCGGMIRYVSNNNPTSTPRPPTSTPRPPTPTPPPCNPCGGEGYSCSGKSGYYCHNNCKYLVGTCSADKTCWANANNWGCTDNCVDGTYQCSGPSCNQSLKKCVNDTWQFQRYCRCIDAECSCNAGLGICQGGCAP